MIRAYPEIYLSNVQGILGDTFDYAVNAYNISGSDFVKMFVTSSVSRRMENGEPDYIAGKSGIEIVLDILKEVTGHAPQPAVQPRFSRSREYWMGWAVAYYQWFSGRDYSQIFRALSYNDLENMYPLLHEADVSKFADIVEARIKDIFPDTNLKRLRTAYGCSQADLAMLSGVSLRSIQMYEQRNKDINKASVETVFKLSKVLGCSVESLLER